jgi:FtsZ-binding cell division protein ZapB
MDEDDSRSGLSDSGRSQDPNKRNVLKAFEATEAEQRAYQERINAKFGQKNAGSEKLVKIDEEDDDRSGLSDSGRSQDPNKYNVLKAFEATDAEQNEHQDRLNGMFGQRNAQSAKQGKMTYNESMRSGLLDSGRSQDPSKQNVLNAFATTDAEQNEHQKRLNAMFGQRNAQSAKQGKMNDEAYN